jgi:hypothetical protein
VCGNHHQKATEVGFTQGNKSIFQYRVYRIRDGQAKGIAEDGTGLFKGDPMLLSVLLGFLFVPLEFKAHFTARLI